jgi:hypothetical protein
LAATMPTPGRMTNEIGAVDVTVKRTFWISSVPVRSRSAER